MAKTIYLDKLLRLTLTRRGKAVAKHPYLRENVVEAVKATLLSQNETPSDPLWTTCKASNADDDASEPQGLRRYQTGRFQ